MEDWPEGWYRDEPARRPGGDPPGGDGSPWGSGAGSSGPSADAAGRFPVRDYSRRGRPAGPDGGYRGGYGDPGGEYDGGYGGRGGRPDNAATARYGGDPGYSEGAAGGGAWPQQPPLRTAPGRGAPPRPPGGRGPRRHGHRGRRILQIIGALVLVVILAAGGFYLYLNSKLTRVNALVSTSAASAGQNWLMTGYAGKVTKSQETTFHVGPNDDPSSDTIMLLHIPAGGGRPILVSLPRDSYVPIPGHGYNKINAAFSFGGPQLLVHTVQNLTGLRINHYMGVGYAGFVSVVNDVGGVRMCLPGPLKSKAAGLDLTAGCHNLDGVQALAFVRDRHSFATEDLQRIQDERLLVKALLTKLTSAGTLVNPFATIPAVEGTARTITVDRGTQLYQLAEAAFALRDPQTTTVPIADANYLTAAGDAVLWNKTQASQLFNDLATDTPPPRNLIRGSTIG